MWWRNSWQPLRANKARPNPQQTPLVPSDPGSLWNLELENWKPHLEKTNPGLLALQDTTK